MEPPGSKHHVQSIQFTQMDGSLIPSYCNEAEKILGNLFPGISSDAIDAVFRTSNYDFPKALVSLRCIEAQRGSANGDGIAQFDMIPSHVEIFVESRPKAIFQLTNMHLCRQIESFPELKLVTKETWNNEKMVSAMEQVVALVESVKKRYPDLLEHNIEPLHCEDVMHFFLDMLNLQRGFVSKKLSGYLDVGFHWTKAANMSSIQNNGLKASKHGCFGPGVYTANNPHAFSYLGDMCIVVARLQGTILRVPQHVGSYKEVTTRTIIGNKSGFLVRNKKDEMKDEIILRSSSQCVAMMRFDKTLRDAEEGKRCIEFIVDSLQSILDSHFNGGTEKAVTSLRDQHNWLQSIKFHSIEYQAPSSLGIPPGSIVEPPSSCNLDEECAICHDTLSTGRCSALLCNHTFHHACIESAFKMKPQCPVCRANVSAPQGKSPSGTMTVTVESGKCDGFNVGSFVIHYDILLGTQMSYHDKPGRYHGGKDAVAYLPNNAEGQNLLKRLKFAFLHGLTFTVGTSLTSGVANQCTWASIHHKTSQYGGVASHGFPDPGYFVNCNEELDGLGVPAAELLDGNGNVVHSRSAAAAPDPPEERMAVPDVTPVPSKNSSVEDSKRNADDNCKSDHRGSNNMNEEEAVSSAKGINAEAKDSDENEEEEDQQPKKATAVVKNNKAPIFDDSSIDCGDDAKMMNDGTKEEEEDVKPHKASTSIAKSKSAEGVALERALLVCRVTQAVATALFFVSLVTYFLMISEQLRFGSLPGDDPDDWDAVYLGPNVSTMKLFLWELPEYLFTSVRALLAFSFSTTWFYIRNYPVSAALVVGAWEVAVYIRDNRRCIKRRYTNSLVMFSTMHTIASRSVTSTRDTLRLSYGMILGLTCIPRASINDSG